MARGADRAAEEDVVDVEEIRRAPLANRRGVRLDPVGELVARALLHPLDLVALVPVEDEHEEQAADIRSHGGRFPEVVLLRPSLLREHGDVVPASAPLARQLPGIDVRPRATQEVAVPDEDPQPVPLYVPSSHEAR